MKVTKAKLAENRNALVEAAGRLIREHGYDGIGVADISKAAGLTHGALYAQFDSKEALAAAAMADGLAKSLARLETLCARDDSIGALLDHLLSPRTRETRAVGCPMTAAGSEVARQGEAVSASFATGFERMAHLIESVLGDTRSRADPRERALAILAAEIGAMTVSRAVAKANPELSDEVLASMRKVLGEVGGT